MSYMYKVRQLHYNKHENPEARSKRAVAISYKKIERTKHTRKHSKTYCRYGDKDSAILWNAK